MLLNEYGSHSVHVWYTATLPRASSVWTETHVLLFIQLNKLVFFLFAFKVPTKRIFFNSHMFTLVGIIFEWVVMYSEVYHITKRIITTFIIIIIIDVHNEVQPLPCNFWHKTCRTSQNVEYLHCFTSDL